ncbi:hypothetical protein [Sphingopyxis fribergensis]
MMPEIGHNGRPDADRIAEYLEGRAQRFSDRAQRTGDQDLRSRATMLNAVASDIRARLFDD